jgi:hypothetical protein
VGHAAREQAERLELLRVLQLRLQREAAHLALAMLLENIGRRSQQHHDQRRRRDQHDLEHDQVMHDVGIIEAGPGVHARREPKRGRHTDDEHARDRQREVPAEQNRACEHERRHHQPHVTERRHTQHEQREVYVDERRANRQARRGARTPCEKKREGHEVREHHVGIARRDRRSPRALHREGHAAHDIAEQAHRKPDQHPTPILRCMVTAKRLE